MSAANDIALAISARVSTISTADGYQTDIGLKHMRGRRRLDESMLPCSVLVERDDKVDNQSIGKAKVITRFIIEGHAKCDPDNPNDMGHKIIADIKKAIFSTRTLHYGDSQAITLTYQGRSIAPREDGVDVVSASVEVSVAFVEDLSNP